jgi:glycosyltransferase involved in cell wall biosynthesis
MTDPPMVGALAVLLGRRHGAPVIVLSQDVFPEIAVELKRLESPLLVGLLRLLDSLYLRRADRVVAIGETMQRRLVAKGAAPERVRVIPNWVDTRRLSPQPKDNEWSRKHGLHDAFVVMHSGNVGHAQDLDSLVRAATFMRDLERLRIVVIGRGARQAELGELAERLEVERLTFLPYQPRSSLSASLSAADLHVVGLASGLAGYVVPSRLYGILAAGRPVIAAADEESETAQLVARIGCGVVLPPGRPELLAEAIRAAAGGELDLASMGRRGREWVEREADKRVAMGRYRELLEEATGAARG